jgi:hypothetical protein
MIIHLKFNGDLYIHVKKYKMKFFVVFIVSKSSSLRDGAGLIVKKTGQSRAKGKGVERGQILNSINFPYPLDRIHLDALLAHPCLLV